MRHTAPYAELYIARQSALEGGGWWGGGVCQLLERLKREQKEESSEDEEMVEEIEGRRNNPKIDAYDSLSSER